MEPSWSPVGAAQLAAQLVPGMLKGGASPVGATHDQAAQLVPGITREGAKPQPKWTSKSKAAAKAVRTATKLSHRVTERYGAGY